MISFRYHLVSIIGVFLALALGIVVGTTALNGPITKDLRNQVDDAKAQRDDLAGQLKQLQGEMADADKFASTYGSKLVEGTLKGKKVLEIVLPGATSEMKDGVERQIAAAGGKISGRVSVTPAYLDPSRGSGIYALATGGARPMGWTAPETNDAGKLGGSLLAYVLLGQGKDTDLEQVLAGFVSLHMIELNGKDVTAAKTVVVLGHGKLEDGKYASNAQLALVSALGRHGHVVVAGDRGSASGGGLVAEIRQSNTDRAKVSTVDNADNAFGQVSAVLALAAATKDRIGQYGSQNGADALFPAPAK